MNVVVSTSELFRMCFRLDNYLFLYYVRVTVDDWKRSIAKKIYSFKRT